MKRFQIQKLNLKMIKYFVLKRKGLQEQVESSVATSFHMAYNNKKSMGHIAHLRKQFK